MLHILLVILKIIGIILAALLGLLVLILLLVLFVPIRYKGKLRKEEELEVTARVNWLLHIISVPVVFRNGVRSAKIKFLGITVKELMKDAEELERDTKEVFQDIEDAEDVHDEEEVKPEEAKRQEARKQKDSVQEETKEDEDAQEQADLWDWEEEERELLESEVPAEEAKSSFVKRLFAKIKAFFLKILGIWKKIKNLKYTFRRFCDRIKKGIQKCKDIKEFATDKRTKAALEQCMVQLKLLIRKLFPKKIRGTLRFGTEDPALTGEILGGISIFYPVFMDNVKVYPDFEQRILEGELFVKGRFCLITVLLVLWRLWRDKNIQYVYRKLKLS